MARIERRVPITKARILSADEVEDHSELQEPRLKAQIRKSSEEYRRGKKRDARTFLAELRPQRKTQT
jgi:hypothetical protein